MAEKEERKFPRAKMLTRLQISKKFQQSQDKQAQQDALRARRAYEAYEREWRRKEKEMAERASAQEQALREERQRQQEARERAIGVEAQKLKEEFYANLEALRDMEERNRHEELERASMNKAYAISIRSQVKEKENAKKKDREDFFLEGIQNKKKVEEENAKLEAIKLRKLAVRREAFFFCDLRDGFDWHQIAYCPLQFLHS
jgi:hypothetical protein